METRWSSSSTSARFDYSKAERELGYTTRPLEETLRDEAKWLKENGHI